MPKKDLSVYVGLVLTMLFWGMTFVFYKISYQSFRPISVILLRLLISVPFIFISARILKKHQKIDPKDFGYLVLLALFEPFLYFMGESYGLTYVSPTIASIIVATIPLLVPVAAYFALKERLSKMNIFGLILSFAGVVIVIFSSEVEMDATIKGVLLMFMAALSAVVVALLIKKLTHKYNGFTITAWQNLIGIFLFLPFFLVIDMKHFISVKPERDAILALLYLAIFGSSITFILFARGIRELGASKANIFANLIPVFAAVFSFLVLKEEMPALKITGIAVVVSGLVLSQVRNLKKRNKQKIARPPYPV